MQAPHSPAPPPEDLPPAAGAEPSDDAFGALFRHGGAVLQEASALYADSLQLVRLEGRLALRSGLLAAELTASAVAVAALAWLALNAALVAALIAAGWAAAAALLLPALLNAAISLWLWRAARRALAEMRFNRSRALLRSWRLEMAANDGGKPA